MKKWFCAFYVVKTKKDLDTLQKYVSGKAYLQTFRKSSSDNARFFKMIAYQSLAALYEKAMLARKPEIDFLLRVAQTTQIKEAIRQNSFVEGSENVVAIFGYKQIRFVGNKVKFKKLEEKELSKGELLQIEKAALLSSDKSRLMKY